MGMEGSFTNLVITMRGSGLRAPCMDEEGGSVPRAMLKKVIGSMISLKYDYDIFRILL